MDAPPAAPGAMVSVRPAAGKGGTSWQRQVRDARIGLDTPGLGREASAPMIPASTPGPNASAAAPSLRGPHSRPALLARFDATAAWDVVVIGGGATGLGVALDAAARGFSVALVEAEDFAKGTSSRATKLVHGGVRYLAQGNVALVREALRERATLLRNAPHLAQPLAFVLPVYGARGRWFDRWFYGAGLALYDALAGDAGLGGTRLLGRDAALALVPGLRSEGLTGGVVYRDGQFDDARLAVALARTAIDRGAAIVNRCAAVALEHDADGVAGVIVEDRETGTRRGLRSRCVVNATGVWVDAVRRMDREHGNDLVAPSQGVHLVVDRAFLPGDHAILVPRTADGRVLFAVPWMGRTLLGTTDTPRDDIASEPTPFRDEVDFILREAGLHLAKAPARADVRSVWVGLRPLVHPLVRPTDDEAAQTKAMSREHMVLVERSGLVTVTGGKWTTYRAMAEDVLARCAAAGLIARREAGATLDLPVVGAPAASARPMSAAPGLHLYGTEASVVSALPGASVELASGFTEAMARFAARHEYARTVEDVLARRSRILFLDAKAAAAAAPRVAEILSEELGAGFDAAHSLSIFLALAERYATLP
jgi:glycerol-3-phosphate dehydrogenase